MTKTCLLTITDDPQGKQLTALNTDVFGLFDDAYLVATLDTSDELLDKISPYCLIRTRRRAGMCQARREVLAIAWENSPGADRFFYCDLDRLIYWYLNFPLELKTSISSFLNYPFTIFGRTQFAMSTYPPLQAETEIVMNKMIYQLFGLNYDLFAGARMFSPGFSRLMMKCKGEDAQLDIEWPLVVQSSGARLHYVSVEGLGYEAECIGMKRDFMDEVRLRCRNLQSVIDFMDSLTVEAK